MFGFIKWIFNTNKTKVIVDYDRERDGDIEWRLKEHDSDTYSVARDLQGRIIRDNEKKRT